MDVASTFKASRSSVARASPPVFPMPMGPGPCSIRAFGTGRSARPMSSWARCPSHVPGGRTDHLWCRAVPLGGTASVLALNVDEAFRLVPHRDAAGCSVYFQGKSIGRGTGVSARVSYAHGPGPMLCSSIQHRAFRPSHELLGRMPKPRSRRVAAPPLVPRGHAWWDRVRVGLECRRGVPPRPSSGRSRMQRLPSRRVDRAWHGRLRPCLICPWARAHALFEPSAPGVPPVP